MMGFLVPVVVILLGAADERPSDRVQPSLVKVEFADQTLAEIVAAIDKQGPNRIGLGPDPYAGGSGLSGVEEKDGAEPKKVPAPRRYRLREREPLAFWEAVDRICVASESWPTVQGTPEPRVVLVPASPDRGFVANCGAFRITLNQLSYARGGEVTPPTSDAQGEPAGRAAQRGPNRLRAVFDIIPEPRLKVVRIDSFTILEAEDEQGRSLDVAGGQRQPLVVGPDAFARDSGSVWLGVPLWYLDSSGRVIRRLKGTVTLECVERSKFRPFQTKVCFEFTDVPMP